jgi:hypothetical protein
MWWEWLIVALVVGLALAWVLRHAYRRFKAGPSAACNTCATAGARRDANGLVHICTDRHER